MEISSARAGVLSGADCGSLLFSAHHERLYRRHLRSSAGCLRTFGVAYFSKAQFKERIIPAIMIIQ